MQFEMWAKGINDFFVCFCCVLVNNIQLLYFYIGYQIDGTFLSGSCHCYYLAQYVYIVYCLLNVVANKLSLSLCPHLFVLSTDRGS